MTNVAPDPLHSRLGPSAEREGHWMTAADDREMQHEHGFVWEALLRTTGLDLTGFRVLDAGCNQGGFLRLAADRFAIAEGRGYDPAAAAVAEAQARAGGRPLQFAASDTVPEGWTGFDVAFSHEVLYLLHDLRPHAAAVFNALRHGGLYFAVIGMHDATPLIARWHRELSQHHDLPPIYSLEGVAAAFMDAGFEAELARLDVRFVPVRGHLDPGLTAWLRYYYEDKVVFRFTKP